VDVNTGEIIIVAEGQGKRRFGGAQVKDINLQRDFDAASRRRRCVRLWRTQ
jgi:curli biogenesis system outer membrane secretion channel CsgG